MPTGIDEFMPHCPIRTVLARVSEKWSMLTLYTIEKEGVLRFKDLQWLIPDISQKMLSKTLKNLEEDDLIHREVYSNVPPKVEYSLTERGKSLLPHINSLIGWAAENIDEIKANRARMGKRRIGDQ